MRELFTGALHPQRPEGQRSRRGSQARTFLPVQWPRCFISLILVNAYLAIPNVVTHPPAASSRRRLRVHLITCLYARQRGSDSLGHTASRRLDSAWPAVTAAGPAAAPRPLHGARRTLRVITNSRARLPRSGHALLKGLSGQFISPRYSSIAKSGAAGIMTVYAARRPPAPGIGL